MPIFSSWLLWALLAAVFAALTALLAKLGVEHVPPDLATLIRTIVVVVALGGVVVITGQWSAAGGISGRSYAYLALSGLATGASWLCYFRALSIGDVARVAPIDKLSVVLVAVFGAAFLGEQLSLTNWLGMALIAGGAILVALKG